MKTKDVRKILIYLALLVVLLVGGGYAAKKGYVSLRQAKLMKQAKAQIEKANDRRAALFLQRVLRADPKNIEANRLLANLAEKGRSPEAILLRSKVVDLAPESTDDRLALAKTALTFGDFVTVSNALEGVSASGRASAGYHNLAGAAAIAARKLSEAEAHFLEASRLAPTNPAPRLNLAVIGLTKTNAQAAAEARATLKSLSTNPLVNCQALRELANDSIRTARTNDAIAYTTQLVQQTNSAFSDKLLWLDVLRATKQAAFEPQLVALKKAAAQEDAHIQPFATWLMARSGPTDALVWMGTLPPEAATNAAVALLAAECRAALKDWTALQSSLEPQQWGALDFLRHGFLARAMRGQDLVSTGKTEWELALKAAKGQKEALVMLLQMAAKWTWTSESEQILWTLCTQYPKEKWASIALGQLLYVNGRTDGLMRLYNQLVKANPNDLPAKNNLAMVALLLDAKQFKPHDLARELYETSPTNATYASTYAFSLFRQEKPAEALTIIEHLNPLELERPSIAAYYGVFLHAAGQADKAKKYLDISAKSPLLPEERQLVQHAQRL